MELTRKGFFRVLGSAAATAGASWLAPPGLTAAVQAATGTKRPVIADVEAFPFSIPQAQVLRIALAAPMTAENVLVRLRTSDGVTGFGESSPYPPVMSETQASDLVLARKLADLVKKSRALAAAVARGSHRRPLAPAWRRCSRPHP